MARTSFRPFKGSLRSRRRVTDEELAALVQRITEAAQALISGDIEGYAARIKHAHDYTLMSPYGGDPARGFDDSDEAGRDLRLDGSSLRVPGRGWRVVAAVSGGEGAAYAAIGDWLASGPAFGNVP
jgi:hypothetical protein